MRMRRSSQALQGPKVTFLFTNKLRQERFSSRYKLIHPSNQSEPYPESVLLNFKLDSLRQTQSKNVLVMIKLGLERASRLCNPIPQPWKAIHVAGTNGKGSVCAFITNALRAHGLKCGTFTSPHLIDKWDCIKINGLPIQGSVFSKIEEHLRARDSAEEIGASEFELLTASAFQAFTDENVDLAVVECGMGGGRDATNVLKHKEVAVITRIGLDHQEFLGEDIRQIAAEKCGIFTYDIEVIYDHHNDPDVITEIRYQTHAAATRPAPSPFFYAPHYKISNPRVAHYKDSFDQKFGPDSYLSSNALVAYRAAHVFLTRQKLVPENNLLARAIMATKIPGRMQHLDLEPLVGQPTKALIDGAHNAQAIERLQHDGIKGLRQSGPISWVFAFSEGKPLDEMILPLIQPGDTVAAVEFGPVDGMEWKRPTPSLHIKEFLDSQNLLDVKNKDFGRNIRDGLIWSADKTHGTHSVAIIGSLYLASDVLRMLRDVGVDVDNTNILPKDAFKRPRKYIDPDLPDPLDSEDEKDATIFNR
jgi:folylpolyglutamate synthase/dihydrofolate synthase